MDRRVQEDILEGSDVLRVEVYSCFHFCEHFVGMTAKKHHVHDFWMYVASQGREEMTI